MKKNEKFNAVMKSILLILGVGIIKLGLESLLEKITAFKENEFLVQLTSNLILGLLLVIFMCYVKKIKPLIFNKNSFFKGLKISLVIIILFTISIISNCITYTDEGHSLLPFGNVLICIISMFAVGFFEEVLFRGLVLNYILDVFGRDTRKNVITAVLISSLLFGLVHITNVLFMGTSISTAATQAVLSIFSGLGFSAIYLRSKSLYSAMFVHGLMDINGSVASGFFGIGQLLATTGVNSDTVKGVIVVICIANVILFSILLRNNKSSEYLEKRENK